MARTPQGNSETAKAARTASRRAPALPKRPVGHPPIYTPEIAAEICRRLAGGEYLNSICADDGMPSHVTVHGWVVDDHEGFFSLYMRARRSSALSKMDECERIAEESTVEAVRVSELRIKTKQWTMERVYQKVFGAKMDLTSGGAPMFSRIERVIVEPKP